MDQPGQPPVEKTNYVLKATTQAEEENYDFVFMRNHPKPITILGAVMHMVKGSLGAGLLSGHVSYMKAGIATALFLNVGFAVYMTTCLYDCNHNQSKLTGREGAYYEDADSRALGGAI